MIIFFDNFILYLLWTKKSRVSVSFNSIVVGSGLCVIINNKDFQQLEGVSKSRRLKKRGGSDIDMGEFKVSLSAIMAFLMFALNSYTKLRIMRFSKKNYERRT